MKWELESIGPSDRRLSLRLTPQPSVYLFARLDGERLYESTLGQHSDSGQNLAQNHSLQGPALLPLRHRASLKVINHKQLLNEAE